MIGKAPDRWVVGQMWLYYQNPTTIGQWHYPMNTNWTISNDYDNSSVHFDNLVWDYSYEKWQWILISSHFSKSINRDELWFQIGWWEYDSRLCCMK